MPQDELSDLLLKKAGFETLEVGRKQPNQIRVMGRVHKGVMGKWKEAIHRLLAAQEGARWKVDISKQYFLRSGSVFYGWRLLFQGEDMESLLPEVYTVISDTPVVELTEVPLVGASPDRNSRTNVGSVDKVPLLAAMRR